MNRRATRLPILSHRADGGSSSNSQALGFGKASLEELSLTSSTKGTSKDRFSASHSAEFSASFLGGSIDDSNNTSRDSSELIRLSAPTILIGDDDGSKQASNSSSFRERSSARRRPSLERLMNNPRTQSVMQDLNCLKFNRLGLYGREAELEILHKTYQAQKNIATTKRRTAFTTSQDNASAASGSAITFPLNLLTLRGESGTGKSAIVKEFQKQVMQREKNNTLFGSGKFDQQMSTPYAAFISSFSHLCSEVINQEDSTIRNAILDAVGETDYALLLDLIPNIGELLFVARGGAVTTDGTSTTNSTDIHPIQASKETEEDFDIVKSEKKRQFLLLRFLAAVVSPLGHKLVIFLDDTQWIDPASLSLLQMILTEDPVLQKSIFFICAHRDNEVHDQHPFAKTLADIETERNQEATRLTVENMSPKAVHGFMTELLNARPEETSELSRIAYKRVQGNMFYLVQFLTALRDGGLLEYSLSTFKWTWDNVNIQKSTVVSGNVLSILMDKMKMLPTRLKAILQIAACLGSTIDEVVITILDRNLQHSAFLPQSPIGSEEDEDDRQLYFTRDVLLKVVEKDLLEELPIASGNRAYCFAHDHIEVAARTLVDSDALPKLKFEIGRILYENREQINYQSLLFNVVDMLNEGSSHANAISLHTQKLLIDCNFEAGSAAILRSAFSAAVSYLQKALDLIPEKERWNDHNYPLTLKLHNMLIKAAYSTKNLEAVDFYVNIVLAQNRPIADKIVSYSTMVTILVVIQHNHVGAIDLAVKVLSALGVTFHPERGALAVVGAIAKTKLLLNKIPLESLLDKDNLKDEHKQLALEVANRMNSSLYASNPELLLCIVLKTLRWSLKYGVSKDTSKCIGFYALLEMALGNTKSATEASYLSLKLAKKFDLMKTEYAPISSAYGFVLPWTTSLHACRIQLFQGFDVGMTTGDLEYGFMNITLYCFFCFCCGKPLSELESDMRNFARQMRAYNQNLQLQFLSLTWQTVLNLMGRCDDPLKLTGEAMDQEDMLKAADADKNPPLRAQLQCHRLQLAVFYRDFELAGKLIGQASNIAAVNPANPIIWRTALFEGIAAFELVRQKKTRWKKKALKAVSKVRKWVDAGNVNCVHILYLLSAEEAAMRKKQDMARDLFNKAVVTAARNAFRYDRALADERCADWHRSVGDDDRADDHLQSAFNGYKEVEAFGKVDEMANRYPFLRPFHVELPTEKSERKLSVSGNDNEDAATSMAHTVADSI